MKNLRTKKLVIYFGLISFLLISSCAIISFHPLYTKDVLVKNDGIIGKWESSDTDENLIWEISSEKKSKDHTYNLKLYKKENPENNTEFEVHLVMLENKLYADFFLDDINSLEESPIISQIHLIPIHTFAYIEIGEKIKIEWLDSYHLEKLIEKKKIKVKHEIREDGMLLLTAKPKDLQKAVIKYDKLSKNKKRKSKDIVLNKIN